MIARVLFVFLAISFAYEASCWSLFQSSNTGKDGDKKHDGAGVANVKHENPTVSHNKSASGHGVWQKPVNGKAGKSPHHEYIKSEKSAAGQRSRRSAVEVANAKHENPSVSHDKNAPGNANVKKPETAALKTGHENSKSEKAETGKNVGKGVKAKGQRSHAKAGNKAGARGGRVKANGNGRAHSGNGHTRRP